MDHCQQAGRSGKELRLTPSQRYGGAITPAQIIIPLIVGLVVFAVASWASRVPPLPEWTVVKNRQELSDERHILGAETLAALQPQSAANNLEYCGYLYRGLTGIAATQPSPGNHKSCPFDAGLGIFATYHSHGGYDPAYDSEVPSTDDLRITISQSIDDYIATPGGRLWYLSAQYDAAMLICDEGCLPQDPDFEPCPAQESAISFTMDQLEERFSKPLPPC